MPRVSEATKVEYRQRLLDAAAAEFAAKGYDAARVDDISLAAGLAKGTIYNYFDSKLDVFRAVVTQWAERTAEERQKAQLDGPVRSQLLALLEADVRVTRKNEEFARTAFRELLTSTSDMVAELMPAWEPIDAQLAAVIAAAQANGQLRNDRSTAELTRILLSLSTGLLIEHWLNPSDVALEDIPTSVVDYFLDGAQLHSAR